VVGRIGCGLDGYLGSFLRLSKAQKFATKDVACEKQQSFQFADNLRKSRVRLQPMAQLTVSFDAAFI